MDLSRALLLCLILCCILYKHEVALCIGINCLDGCVCDLYCVIVLTLLLLFLPCTFHEMGNVFKDLEMAFLFIDTT